MSIDDKPKYAIENLGYEEDEDDEVEVLREKREEARQMRKFEEATKTFVVIVGNLSLGHRVVGPFGGDDGYADAERWVERNIKTKRIKERTWIQNIFSPKAKQAIGDM